MNRPATQITSLYTRELVIAGITLAAIALHLVLRFAFEIESTVLGFPWPAIPLLAALVVGGIPLVAGLVIRLVRFEFSSDLLAGISIVIPQHALGWAFIPVLLIGLATGGYASRRRPRRSQ